MKKKRPPKPVVDRNKINMEITDMKERKRRKGTLLAFFFVFLHLQERKIVLMINVPYKKMRVLFRTNSHRESNG